MNLFFYKREVDNGKIYTDSFNLNKVVRSMQLEDEKIILVLDDIHERSEQVPDIKNGKVVGSKRERNTFQTEITLTGEDVKRFNNLANK
jgi:mannose/fructose/N-acetylgalactosamine-specific phosphotransferase system component IIB